jgi:SAM-dependent methyltransferase
VTPFWHPLSTILLFEPRCFATDGLVRMLLNTEGRARLFYAGDRMWPTLEYGSSFTVSPAGDGTLSPGTVVLVSRADIPDLLRVASADGDAVTLTADSEPEANVVLSRDAVLGLADLPSATPVGMRGSFRRLSLDLREAWKGRPDAGVDPAATVRDKYESQAAHYARLKTPEIDPRLLERFRERVPAGRSVLVVGSGAGRECFALAKAGWRVSGVEFAPAMVELSSKEAASRGLEIDFHRADIREHAAGERSRDGVLFTYDVYSFLPHRCERVRLLRRLRSGLRPGGVVFLSARRLRSLYDRLILGLQWLALQRTGEWEWGDSHTRWIPNEGTLHRSFVHVFSPAQLRSEAAAAGFDMEPWENGHCVLTPSPTAMIRT